jgi:anti-sigma factor RsiW
MNCQEARTHMLDRRRGTLDDAARAALEEHLAGCASCKHEDAADRLLSEALEQRLPRHPAPVALRRSLEAKWDPRPARVGARRLAGTMGAMAAGAAIAVIAVSVWHARPSSDVMVAEAVNDHLRVLYSSHPVEVESGGIHQVKPWFEGRVDFAPVEPFAGDDDFPLQGGSVAYFMDRKAATFVFKRRLHLITLFVFPSQGLPWPAVETQPIDGAHGTLQTSRGFHVLMWRKGDLGYALVSDVDPKDLTELGAKVAAGG